MDFVAAATSSSNTDLNSIGIVRGSHGTLAATAIQSRDIFIRKVEVVYFWLIVMWNGRACALPALKRWATAEP